MGIVSAGGVTARCLTVAFVLSTIFPTNVEGKFCGPKSVYNCLKRMDIKYETDLTRENIFRLGPIFDVDSYEEFCRDLDALEECLATATVCEKRGRYLMGNADFFMSASRSLCYQAEADRYNQTSIYKCFSRDSVKVYIQNCHDEMLDQMRTLSKYFLRYENTNSRNLLPIIIGYYNEHLRQMGDCIQSSLTHINDIPDCVDRVYPWFQNYLPLMVEPLWYQYASRYYMRIIYIYLILSLAIICLFVVYLFFKSYGSHFEEKLNYIMFDEAGRSHVKRRLSMVFSLTTLPIIRSDQSVQGSGSRSLLRKTLSAGPKGNKGS